METVARLSTHEVIQLLFGVPESHKHCRLIIKTDQNQVLVFSEALVAAIVRCYVSVKTHPTRSALELTQQVLKSPKDDFANYQLMETNKDSELVQKEISKYID